MIANIAADNAPAVKGIFDDLLGLVAGLDREQREGGVIRGVDGTPADVGEISELLRVPLEMIELAFIVLTDRRVGLIRAKTVEEIWPVPTPISDDSTQIPGNSEALRVTPGDSGAEPGAEPGAMQCSAAHINTEQSKPGTASCWESACAVLRTAYPDNETIDQFREWLSNQSRMIDPDTGRKACAKIVELIRKSRTKDNPPGWFVGAVKRPVSKGGFSYRPNGKAKRGDPTKGSDIARAVLAGLVGAR